MRSKRDILDSEALLELHAAVEIDQLWAAVDGLMRTYLPCHRVTLFLGHIGMHEARKVFTSPALENSDKDYYTKRAEKNPFNRFIEANIGVSHYRFSDVIEDYAAFKESPFFKAYAGPEGWTYGLSGLIWLGDELHGMFSLYRSESQGDFSNKDVQTLNRLLPYISVAIDRVRRIHRERLYRTVLEDFNRNMPVGILLLDWELRLMYSNTEAVRLAANWNLGPDADKRFNSREVFKLPPAVIETCNTLRERILQEGNEEVRVLGKTPTPVEDRPEGIECTVQPIRINSGNIAYPGFFVVFESLNADNSGKLEPISPERIVLLNQLSPSERELALLVGEGLSNKEIANRLNKSVLTIKKQLNSAFGKLNIGNRARLIALLR